MATVSSEEYETRLPHPADTCEIPQNESLHQVWLSFEYQGPWKGVQMSGRLLGRQNARKAAMAGNGICGTMSQFKFVFRRRASNSAVRDGERRLCSKITI
jgi:hypothetical protein